ncbi:MAG: ATP-binding protein, partial [Phycicoccus sp.]|nr:ATP-binding protein [Phycicoccus sp.]
MDRSGVGAYESPFVGEQRRQLVARLLAEFDNVSQSGTPRWWSLEEDSGWGKTRIIHELYRRLAAERQNGAKYWSPALLPQAPVAKNAGSLTSLMSLRKKVIPESVAPELEAVPQWFWWGISCATRSGTPVQALAADLTQFADHQVGLDQRWRQLASPEPRLGAGRGSEQGEVVETSAGEVLGVAAGLASLPVPGLGVLALAAEWAVPGGRDCGRTEPPSPVAYGDGRDRPDLVDELAPALERLGAAGLPIVITIEDLHLADESLVELLARLLAAQGAPVLVISTTWRGLLDDDSLPAHQLIERVHPDRVCRVLTDEALPDLAVGEREVIVRAILPEVTAWNANLVASSFTNPLALQLACHVDLLSNADRDLGADEVGGLPHDVDGLFGQLWSELAQTTREVLMVAALSTPAGISDSMGLADFRWDSSLLTAVSNTEAAAWVRSDDTRLRLFPDPAQYDVALSQAKVAYDEARRRAVYEAMARAMSAGVAESPAQEEHRARLRVALAYVGFLAWDESTVAGSVALCSSLLADPDVDSCRYVIRLVESALQSTSTSWATGGHWLTLGEAYARTLGGSGRVAEAITALEQLLADQRRVLGPDALQTLATRGALAGVLAGSDRARGAEAITA